MPFIQRLFVIIMTISVFITVLYFIKKGKLKEEYSWLWFLLSFSMLISVLWFDILVKISVLLEIKTVAFLCLFIAIIFLFLLCIQYSIVISKNKTDIKNLVQKISLLENKIDEITNIQQSDIKKNGEI